MLVCAPSQAKSHSQCESESEFILSIESAKVENIDGRRLEIRNSQLAKCKSQRMNERTNERMRCDVGRRMDVTADSRRR